MSFVTINDSGKRDRQSKWDLVLRTTGKKQKKQKEVTTATGKGSGMH